MQHVGRLVVQRLAEVGEFLVEQLDDVEAVEDDLHLAQVRRRRRLVGCRYVHGHYLDLGSAGLELLPERLQGVARLAVTNENHCPGLEIQDEGQIAMSLADGDFVDGDVSQVLQLGLGEVTRRDAMREVILLDVLEQVLADAQVYGHVTDGHSSPQL